MPGVENYRSRVAAEPGTQTAFLVIDTESIPDGRLLKMVKYGDQNLTEDEAIEKARQDARETSYTGSDFIPYTFQLPVAVCVARVGTDFGLQAVAALDAPLYRTKEIVKKFWLGLSFYTKCKLVTFNGRSLRPAADGDSPRSDHGCDGARTTFTNSRNRFQGNHIDLMDWLSNYGACRIERRPEHVLAQRRGGGRQPGCGKMDVCGRSGVRYVQAAASCKQINDYCMFDTLDTYFVFLRTRVLTGDVSPEQEAELIARAKRTLAAQTKDLPALKTYLDNWTDFQPWPA